MPKIVLVCDDERHILESVTYVVRQEGYQVLTAEDGVQALRLAQTELPHLLLLDVILPQKNGFEVCRELKSDPATNRICIILLTCLGQDRDMEQAYQCGADDFLTKPFSPRQLRQRLHELLDD
jgi:two-component system, OmpR family, alkaline phosphatase synthesis response regulator PhoP